ncbi:hypothetical protein SEA_MOLLYMUR_55 [Gordonia phage Mollymur]|uniref:Uncharacterized protein n=1 Tax=Gordonia phage Mollymur TaxID=2590895 RepID=A0A4Y6EDM2_9CAUD|nr:hypothetical protein PQB84_gp070 [Gordonia phage Mollymur]QDF15416.1 hypothetical protein SEA_MOLLYMUR_55 [Gordonia phage Mollymur]QIG58720.1 hypothetical protein SEA_DATBOI_55 [Gordonia phage DatBoi]
MSMLQAILMIASWAAPATVAFTIWWVIDRREQR